MIGQFKNDQWENDQSKNNQSKNDWSKTDQPKNNQMKNNRMKNNRLKNNRMKNNRLKNNQMKNDQPKTDRSKKINQGMTNRRTVKLSNEKQSKGKNDQPKNYWLKSNQMKNDQPKIDWSNTVNEEALDWSIIDRWIRSIWLPCSIGMRPNRSSTCLRVLLVGAAPSVLLLRRRNLLRPTGCTPGFCRSSPALPLRQRRGTGRPCEQSSSETTRRYRKGKILKVQLNR